MNQVSLAFISSEREGQAQRNYEAELRKRNLSGEMSSPLSGGSTTSKKVIQTSDDQGGNYHEVVEEKGLLSSFLEFSLLLRSFGFQVKKLF